MPKRPPSTSSCVEHPVPSSGRRLSGSETVVIIVVVGISAALFTTGTPILDILRLLAGAGLIAGITIALSTRASLRTIRQVLRAALAAA